MKQCISSLIRAYHSNDYIVRQLHAERGELSRSRDLHLNTGTSSGKNRTYSEAQMSFFLREFSKF